VRHTIHDRFASVSWVLPALISLFVGACGYTRFVGVLPEEEARVFTGSGSLTLFGSDIDVDGNYYLVGNVEGVVELGSIELRGDTAQTAFVASFTREGEPRWGQTWSGSFARATAVDVRGESVGVTGYVRGPISGPFPLTTGSRQELFVFSFDRQSGAPLSSPLAFASAAGNVQGKGIVSSGSFTGLCGHYIGAVDFGLGSLAVSPLDADHGFVVVFDSVGEPVWSESVVGANTLLGGGFLRADGSAIASGVYRDGIIGGRNAVGQDAIVISFSSDGTTEYELGFGSAGGDQVDAVAAFEDGVVVVGTSEGELSIAGETLDARGGRDAFIVRLDETGGVVWARLLDGTGDESLRRIRVDEGRIYVAGDFDDELRFGDHVFRSNGGRDVMVLVFDADGNESDAAQLGGTGNESVGGFEVQGSRAWLAVSLDGETVLDSSGPQLGLFGLRTLQF
jgi:hypothetical protein